MQGLAYAIGSILGTPEGRKAVADGYSTYAPKGVQDSVTSLTGYKSDSQKKENARKAWAFREAIRRRQAEAALKAKIAQLEKEREAAKEVRRQKIAGRMAWSVVRHAVMGALLPVIGNAMMATLDVMDAADIIDVITNLDDQISSLQDQCDALQSGTSMAGSHHGLMFGSSTDVPGYLYDSPTGTYTRSPSDWILGNTANNLTLDQIPR